MHLRKLLLNYLRMHKAEVKSAELKYRLLVVRKLSILDLASPTRDLGYGEGSSAVGD